MEPHIDLMMIKYMFMAKLVLHRLVQQERQILGL